MDVGKTKCIKMIGTNKFVLELIATESGNFYLVEERTLDRIQNKPKTYSQPMTDFNLALSLFDTRLIQLEGN